MVAVYKFPDCDVEVMISCNPVCESTGPGVRIRHEYTWHVTNAGHACLEIFPDVALVEDALAKGENALLKAMEADPNVKSRVFLVAPALRALLEEQDIGDAIADVPTSTTSSPPPL